MPSITNAHRDQIRALHAKGLSRNAIAKEVGLSTGSVTKVCRELSLSFDRSSTYLAVQARQIDLKDRRQTIVQQLYDRAQANIDRLNGDGYKHRVQLANDSFVVVDDAPPSPDERNHASSINSYLSAAARLEAVDTDAASTSARSMLTKLGEALGITPPGDA